jgi:menaquinone-dependent protoporphyrinogen oxidase
MGKILVAYTTNAGSTSKVADTIGKELGQSGLQVDVRRLEEVASLEGYSGVVVGAPMIVGWHRAAVKFVKQNHEALSRLPVAYFMTAMSLTRASGESMGDAPVSIDPELPKAPKNPKRLSFKERFASVSNYLSPALKAGPTVKPISIGIFGGKLEIPRLKLWQIIFVLLVIQPQTGDFRNWPFIKEWARSLAPKFAGTPLP